VHAALVDRRPELSKAHETYAAVGAGSGTAFFGAVCSGVSMRERLRLLMLKLARLFVGYPATWLLAVGSSQRLPQLSGTARYHYQQLLWWLIHIPIRQGAAYLSLRDSELTVLAFAVMVSAFILTLWLL
jgi:hypothetical protein